MLDCLLLDVNSSLSVADLSEVNNSTLQSSFASSSMHYKSLVLKVLYLLTVSLSVTTNTSTVNSNNNQMDLTNETVTHTQNIYESNINISINENNNNLIAESGIAGNVSYTTPSNL